MKRRDFCLTVVRALGMGIAGSVVPSFLQGCGVDEEDIENPDSGTYDISPDIQQPENILGVVDEGTALEARVLNNPSAVEWNIHYAYPGASYVDAVTGIRTANDGYLKIYAFLRPGSYDIDVTAYNSAGSDMKYLESLILDRGITRFSDVYEGLFGVGENISPISDVDYDVWQRFVVPQLEGEGVSASTLNAINDAENSDYKRIISVGVVELSAQESGMVVLQIETLAYNQFGDGERAYEAIDISESDAQIIKGILT